VIALTSLILSPRCQFAELGWFLHPKDWRFRQTVTADMTVAQIKGATLINVDDLKGTPVIELVISNRELHPLIGLGSTKIRMLEGDKTKGESWRRFDEVKVGDVVIVAENCPLGMGITWANIRKVRSSTALHSIWCNTPTVAGTLVLHDGRSFATPAGFILCRDDARLC